MATMKCPNCGADISTDVHFCQYCGSTVTPPPEYTQAPPQQPNYVPPQQPPYDAQSPYGQPGQWQSGAPYPPGYERKSKIAAGLLGIFLGSLGIHNFYLGYTNRALVQLLVSLLTCGVGAFFMGIWGLIEGIQILTGSIAVDARGVPLGD